MPKTNFKHIGIENNSFLKLFRQKNATHVGDRENALSVLSNLDYDQVGRQKYQYKMVFEEPDIEVERKVLVKLGQIPMAIKGMAAMKKVQVSTEFEERDVI